MDKLVNINIENNRLTFTVDTDIDLSEYDMEVHIDETDNLQNILKDKPIHSTSLYKDITVDSDKNVTVTNDDILSLDWNMKYFTLRCFNSQSQLFFHGIYYNPEIIYSAEIRKLHSNCSTCLDDATMQNIMLVVYKRQLLEYALASDHFKDAMQLYIDICRLLEISLHVTFGSDSCCDDCIFTQDNRCLNTECGKCFHLEKDSERETTTMFNCNNCCSSCSNGCCKL